MSACNGSGRGDAAAAKAQGCDRLVIDLRGCLGGSLGSARLVSYLRPDRIPIGYDVTRKGWNEGTTSLNSHESARGYKEKGRTNTPLELAIKTTWTGSVLPWMWLVECQDCKRSADTRRRDF